MDLKIWFKDKILLEGPRVKGSFMSVGEMRQVPVRRRQWSGVSVIRELHVLMKRKELCFGGQMVWVLVLTTTYCKLLAESLTSLICKIRNSNTTLIGVAIFTTGD